jgi:hypothetical protein
VYLKSESSNPEQFGQVFLLCKTNEASHQMIVIFIYMPTMADFPSRKQQLIKHCPATPAVLDT